jgi:transposase
MIRAGFLDPESRSDLIDLARDGSVAHRLARRANALVLLDGGMSCGEVAKVLLLDDDTVRTWYRLYKDEGIEGLASFGYDGSTCRLSDAQQDKLRTWIAETLPRTTREVGVWIETECGVTYDSRSGLIALLHRLGMEHRKPKAVSCKLDPDKQSAFIPRSVQNPKLLGRDDTEVIRYLITIGVPFSGHLLAQKGQDFGFEVSKCRMTSIVGDMLVHQPP